MSRSGKPRMWTVSSAAVTVAFAAQAGCTPESGVRQTPVKEVRAAPPTVTIDFRDNGAGRAVQPPRAELVEPARPLDYAMAGHAAGPGDASSAEARAGAVQAAIIDALHRAVLEQRRREGLPNEDFSVRLGRRVTLAQASAGGSTEVRVTVAVGGAETVFVLRDGALTHPPHDLRIVERIFQATGGDYALLSTEWQPAGNVYLATVGCYGKVEPTPAMAGDASAEVHANP